jgi:hypothetical protein
MGLSEDIKEALDIHYSIISIWFDGCPKKYAYYLREKINQLDDILANNLNQEDVISYLSYEASLTLVTAMIPPKIKWKKIKVNN